MSGSIYLKQLTAVGRTEKFYLLKCSVGGPQVGHRFQDIIHLSNSTRSIRASLCTPDTSPHHHQCHRGDGEAERHLVGFWTHSRPALICQNWQFKKLVGPLLSTWHGWSPHKLVASQRLKLTGLHAGKAFLLEQHIPKWKVLPSVIWLLVLSGPTAPSQNEVLGGKSHLYISYRHLGRESNFREDHKEFLSSVR